ncbi:vacuolar cation/proton exchanger 2-like [Canna indica]|uniref:Vacuolar cation/proton exchanger n=1 Tax=Canna indica TaxID=4628 RepID=A0AAQ3KMX5_9LILI|nr:vacuolar cation/proton exchanger 2-like [Canna indica]
MEAFSVGRESSPTTEVCNQNVYLHLFITGVIDDNRNDEKEGTRKSMEKGKNIVILIIFYVLRVVFDERDLESSSGREEDAAYDLPHGFRGSPSPLVPDSRDFLTIARPSLPCLSSFIPFFWVRARFLRIRLRFGLSYAVLRHIGSFTVKPRSGSSRPCVFQEIEMGPNEKTDLELEENPIVSSPLGARKMHTFEHIGSIAAVSQYSHMRTRNKVLMSIYIVLVKAKINVLLPFGPLAIMLHYLTGKHGWVFFFSLIGITPLAERLGYATEQLACYTGPTVGGLLNATFGNATEMIISIYALKNGMIRVVQQSLLGSILSNMLLVLGCAFFTGGIVHCNKDQTFNKAAAVVNSGLLLMAVMGLMFPAVLHFTRSELHYGKSELALSRFSSCIMLVAYASYLFFQLKSQNNLYKPIDEDEVQNETETEEEEAPEITQWEAISWLSVLTVWVSILSGYLVDAIQGASESMNMPVAFISVILLPIVGNAAEHASAIMFAMKDKLDITLGVAIGSSTQISMFVIPFCVVVGWIMGKQMDLNFQLFETATLFITVLVVAFMLQEGTANYFKGLMLILCYLIVAASFFVHIDPAASDD